MILRLSIWTTIATAALLNFGAAAARADDDRTGIEHALLAYNAALNGGETAKVMRLYADDGVFMPPFSASAVGKPAVKATYDTVFGELTFHVRFDIAEVVQVAPTWAFVRTNSSGTTDHRSTGKTTAEANLELFLMRKEDDGDWRIARYSFSPTNPPSR